MVPRRIDFHLKYVDSTFYTVFRESLGFFLVFVSNWPSLYIHRTNRPLGLEGGWGEGRVLSLTYNLVSDRLLPALLSLSPSPFKPLYIGALDQ
jgi:hypothetical protein